jgi:hypothetical protein
VTTSTTFINCTWEGATASNTHGGAIYSTGGELTISSCSFIQCKTTGSGNGGGIWKNSEEEVNIEYSSFDEGEGSIGGGVLVMYGRQIMKECLFSSCSCRNIDGACNFEYCSSSSSYSSSNFSSNSSPSSRGCFLIAYPSSKHLLLSLLFQNNSAVGMGAAVFLHPSLILGLPSFSFCFFLMEIK